MLSRPTVCTLVREDSSPCKVVLTNTTIKRACLSQIVNVLVSSAISVSYRSLPVAGMETLDVVPWAVDV